MLARSGKKHNRTFKEAPECHRRDVGGAEKSSGVSSEPISSPLSALIYSLREGMFIDTSEEG